MLNLSFDETKKVLREAKHCSLTMVGTAGEYDLADLVINHRVKALKPPSWFKMSDGWLLVCYPGKLSLQLAKNELEFNFSGSNLLRSNGNVLCLIPMLQKYCKEEYPAAWYHTKLGTIGYYGFEFIYYSIIRAHSERQQDNVRVPDVKLIFFRKIAIVQDRVGRWVVLCCTSGLSYIKARRKIGSYFKAACTVSCAVLIIPSTETWKRSVGSVNRKVYLNLVLSLLAYIRQGKLMQAQLSRRFNTALSFYECKALMALLLNTSLSSYTFELNYSYFRILGTSPEVLVKDNVSGAFSSVVIKPIAGTRPRGKDIAQDRKFKDELTNDPKETSEHVMLIDLARNDLAAATSAEPTETTLALSVESYSYVQHIVSMVQCKKNVPAGTGEVLENVFPAGTVSGTPKLKAINLISSLEKLKRSFYGGAVGLVSPKKVELAITIRSCFLSARKFCTQSAAGIVLESDPISELRETENKVVSILDIIRNAGSGTILWNSGGVSHGSYLR